MLARIQYNTKNCSIVFMNFRGEYILHVHYSKINEIINVFGHAIAKGHQSFKTIDI